MKNLSIWANQNRFKTIFLLVILHTILNYFYFYLGAWLFLDGIKTPKILTTIASSLFILATLFYPLKNQKQGIYKNTIFKRKFWQAIAMVSVALFFIHGGNHISRSAMANNNVNFSVENIVLDFNTENHFTKKEARKIRRSLKRKFQKRLRANIKMLRQLKKKSEEGERILLFVLTAIAVTTILGFLVLLLSCGPFCNGNEALGWMIVIGGAAIITWILVKIFRKMVLNKRVPKPKEEPKPVKG